MGNMKLSYMMLCLLPLLSLGAAAEQCGRQAVGTVCKPGDSTPTPTPMMLADVGGGGGDIGRLVSSSVFDQMLKYRNDARCAGHGFYTYDAFIAAARSFNGFGTTGNDTIRKRELAAFLAQTSHETTGGWASAPDGPYAWGYCYVNESNNPPDYCTPSKDWPCAPGKKYYGRGPIQLSYNFNYGQAGRAIGVDLLNNPDLASTDSIVSFKTAIWFWMTPQGNLSSHDVITGKWTPTGADSSAERVPGNDMIVNIVNDGLECGQRQGGQDSLVNDLVGFYRRYCQILGVSPGDNLDCNNNQRPSGSVEPISTCWISTQIISC